MMEKKKKFDAVKMMREIREKLSEKYWKQPDLLKKEMQEIRDIIPSLKLIYFKLCNFEIYDFKICSTL